MTGSNIDPEPLKIYEDVDATLAALADYEQRSETEKWYGRKFKKLFWLIVAALAVLAAFGYFGS